MYLWKCSNSTNYVQTFHEPPSIRPRCSSRSEVGHPRAGTKLHPGQENPKLGWGYRKTAQSNQQDSLQEPSYAHYSQNIIPHMLVPPRSIHLHKHSPSVLHLPSLGLATGQTGSLKALWLQEFQLPSKASKQHLPEILFVANILTFINIISSASTTCSYHERTYKNSFRNSN